MSLLTICQDAADEIGFPQPTSIVGNSDSNAKQLLRLANREGEELSQKTNWQELVTETSITLATGTQTYALASDLRWIIPNTTWNRSDKRIVITPLSSREWQFLKGWATITGLNLRARIRAGNIEFEQTIAAADNGKSVYYEYISNKWAETSGGTAQRKFQADTDVCRLDEELVTQGVVWRFKKAKGLDWQEDYQFYIQLRDSQISRDGDQRRVSFGDKMFGEGLGVNVSDRNYG